MNTRQLRGSLLASWFISAALLAGAAGAQTATTIQTLDRIDVNSTTHVIEMAFDTPNATTDYTDNGVAGTNFRACALTPTAGLYCLDGKDVRRWANPAQGGTGAVLFNCNDVPGLDSKSSDTCTSLTVDQAGTLWLAGKNKGKSYSLVKVLAGSQTDPGWQQIGTSGYWAYTWASGRPLLLDLTAVDGESAAAFTYGPGILGLEQRKTVEFFPADHTKPLQTIGSGKSDWGLAGNEQLQGLTLWQPKDSSGAVTGNYVLVTTSNGRVLSNDTDTSSAASQVLAAIPGGTTACNALDPFYAIRSSAKSGLVYITNRNYCTTIAYNPQETPATNTTPLIPAWSVVKTLSTAPYEPEGLTIAPGISINLANCTTNCTLISGADISAVNLSSTESGMTLFQIKGIPDCRYIPAAEACSKTITRPDGTTATTIVNLDGSYGTPGEGDPATQYLNVTPMLPSEITSLYDNSGVPPKGLPDLLISPQYRGQETQDFVFQAFFAVVQPGVTFTGTFNVEYWVDQLAGASLGCTPASNSLSDLLKWDVITKVSESYKSVGGKYVDTLLNTGCGSSRGTSFGFSLLPYNLEITPDTYYGTYPTVIKDNDAVFARLVQKLYDDLGDITQHYACTAADDPGNNAPISPGLCSTLIANWTNGKDKLDKCLAATYQPKQSSGNQNCQAFQTQFQSFEDTLGVVGPYGPDPANRKGELDARSKVIDYVFQTRFLPSVPTGGFCVEAGTC